jgi:hypothetical protein
MCNVFASCTTDSVSRKRISVIDAGKLQMVQRSTSIWNNLILNGYWKNMKILKQLFVAGLIAGAGIAAFPTVAAAASFDHEQQGFAHGPDYYFMQMEAYKSEIARMSPEDRAKFMSMQDKLMQMEMDDASSKMKMAMEMEKMKRDIQMFVLTHSGHGQSAGS